jgi:polyprenyl P-hydroxybenzoate/phenylacrylic acid decarboxylase-like protein
MPAARKNAPAGGKKAAVRATVTRPPPVTKQRLIVGITGATGAMYGVRLLETLRALPDWEAHLVVSDAGVLNAWQELGTSRKDLESLADVVYNPRDIGAAIASGSFLTAGMIIAPCSMKTLAAVAHAHADDLISRAADVILKERRRLVLLTREAPLNLAHLRNMVAVTEMGGVIFPPVPAFYARPQSIDEIINHTTGRVLDLFGLHSADLPRWQGMRKA